MNRPARSLARRRLLTGAAALGMLAGRAGGLAAADDKPGGGLQSLLTPWSGPIPPLPELIDLGQHPVSLDSYRGRWVLLNLWATWCGPCKEEMPSLERLRARVQPRGVEVLAVSLGDSVNQIESFLEKTPVKLPILIDTRKQMLSRWLVRVLPTTFVFDPAGVVRFSHVGAREWDDPRMVAALESLSPK